MANQASFQGQPRTQFPQVPGMQPMAMPVALPRADGAPGFPPIPLAAGDIPAAHQELPVAGQVLPMGAARQPMPAPRQPTGPLPYPAQILAGNWYTTFNQLYSDEARDPCARSYARIMNRFDAGALNAPEGQALFNQVVSAGSLQLHAYLCCGTGVGNNRPRIYCLHSPVRFTASLDGQTTRWDNWSFAFLGELVQGQITNILLPNSIFDEVTIWARPQAYILAHLEDLTEEEPFFPALQAHQDDAEEIETRYLMYLPAVYVRLLLNSSGYTPRQVWERLYPAIAQRQEIADCRPLLNWLQAATMGAALINPDDHGNPLLSIPLCSPPADERLLQHRTQILHQLLPGLSAPPQTLETAISQMATALLTQTNEQILLREQKAAAALEPALPSAKFTVTLPVLLEYLQLTDERELPILWHKWANCKKKQELQVLRETLEAFARSPQAYSPSVPTVTAKLVQDLLHFSFLGDSADDIRLGLHPFIITDGNAESRHANREVARLYGYLHAGDASVSLADLEALQAKEVRSVPLTYWELEKTLGTFGNLITTVLGVNHPLCVAYKAMWVLLQSGMRDDLHTVIEYRGYVKPTHVLRSIQLQFWNWFV